jgi:CheY-like chemotaxis protein
MLCKEGWKIVEAENGQIALQQVAKARPALILLDLMMPEMNGFEFIDELRKTESWRSIPIVVVTAMSLTPEDQSRLTEQAQKVLLKGIFSHDRILEEVRSIVAATTRDQPIEG